MDFFATNSTLKFVLPSMGLFVIFLYEEA